VNDKWVIMGCVKEVFLELTCLMPILTLCNDVAVIILEMSLYITICTCKKCNTVYLLINRATKSILTRHIAVSC